MSLFNRVHRARARHAKVRDMTNPHETLEELEARLQAKIKDYRAGESGG